jgi:transcriptional regulator with XRE-family HTH domain
VEVAVGSQIELEQLRALLFLRRITIKVAAKQAGIPAERLGRLFRGDRSPRPGEVQKIAKANGVQL